jgi:hypothetical protein
MGTSWRHAICSRKPNGSHFSGLGTDEDNLKKLDVSATLVSVKDIVSTSLGKAPAETPTAPGTIRITTLE